MENSTYQRLTALPLPDRAEIKSDIRFGLIVPPSPYVVPCGWEWVHKAPFEGPSIIASLIKGLGYRFTLFDQRDCFDANSLSGKLNGLDIIGIATYEDNFPYIKKIIEITKKENPGHPVILGGPLVSSAPELIMKNTKADYAVIGEGELTLIELMDFLSQNERALPVRKIKGLVWKKSKNRVIVNQVREQMMNLDAVPFQDFSVWKRFENGFIPEIPLSYSRGCPFNCSFCYRPMPKLRYKSIERVRNEIEYLKKWKFKMVWWNDLTFLANKNFVHRLLKKAFSVYDFNWCCFTRVAGIDLPILKAMKKRNCNIINFGIEAIDKDILDSYRKEITKGDTMHAISLVREAGIKCGGLFIVGALKETKKSLQNLIDFCRRFKEITRVKYLSVIPGTSLYNQAVKEGLIKDEIAHLEWLSREESIEEDIEKEGFVFLSKNISKHDLRIAYRAINTLIEKKPYNYRDEKNFFLKQPKKFKKRMPPI